MTREIEQFYPKTFLARQGKTATELRERLAFVYQEFAAALAALPEDVLTKPVKPGGWSPVEIADHVLKAGAFFLEAASGVLAGGPPPVMARGRLGAEGKPLSPEAQLPAADRERSALLAELTAQAEAIGELARRAEERGKLELICLEHAFFGPMTVLECLQLGAWHARHHQRQFPPQPPAG